MLLVAIHTWLPRLRQHSGELWFVGDAKGVLQGILAGKARSPRINLLIAEISLLLSETDHILAAEHLWSEHNHVCDKLSRLKGGDDIPHECTHAHRCEPVKGPFCILGTEGSLQLAEE